MTPTELSISCEVPLQAAPTGFLHRQRETDTNPDKWPPICHCGVGRGEGLFSWCFLDSLTLCISPKCGGGGGGEGWGVIRASGRTDGSPRGLSFEGAGLPHTARLCAGRALIQPASVFLADVPSAKKAM